MGQYSYNLHNESATKTKDRSEKYHMMIFIRAEILENSKTVEKMSRYLPIPFFQLLAFNGSWSRAFCLYSSSSEIYTIEINGVYGEIST